MKTKTYKVDITGNNTHPPFDVKLKVHQDGKLISSKKKFLEADFDCIVYTDTMHSAEDFFGGWYKIADKSFTKIPEKIRTAPGLTSLERAFCGCQKVSYIDLTYFDTSNVTTMYEAFGSCYRLETLDLSNFDTSKVTNMEEMFGSCGRLNADFSQLNTSNVTNMKGMFQGAFQDAGATKNLDLKAFDVSKVTNMRDMFDQCRGLESIDITGWDTSKVQDFGSMFYDCESLMEIKGVIDMASATSYKNMFSYETAHALKTKVKIKNMPKDFFSDKNNSYAKSMIEIVE